MSTPRSTRRILSTGIASLIVAAAAHTAHGQAISITGASTYTQNFNTLGTVTAAWTDGTTLAGWYAGINNNATADGNLTAGTGGAVATGLLNLASVALPADRALGSAVTGTGGLANIGYGVLFQNNSGGALTISGIGYTGEIYRTNTTANTVERWDAFTKVSSTLFTDVEPGVSANTAANGTFTALDSMDFTLGLAAAGAQVDGNAAANRVVKSIAYAGIVLAAGDFFMFRWIDSNQAGTDAHQAIDDFSITFISPPKNLVFNLGHSAGGAPNGVFEASVAQYWLEGLTPRGFTTVDNVAFSQDPAGTSTVNVPADVTAGTITVSNATGTYSIGGAGKMTGTFTKSNGGTLVLTSANTFTSVSLNGGTIVTQAPAALGTSGITLTSATTLQTDSALTLSGIVTGAGPITKTGAGTLTLPAVNTYTGATAVNAGRLVVSGSPTGASAHTIASGASILVTGALPVGSGVTVQSGGTLLGMGAVNDAVTVQSGGILEAGSGNVGTLTIGTLTLGAGAGNTSTLHVSPTSGFNVTTLTANGGASTATIVLGGAPVVGQTYVVVNYTGGIGGTGFSSFNLQTGSRVIASLVDNTTNTSIDISVTGADAARWSGALGTAWNTSTLANPKNWVLNSNGTTPTDYIEGDSVSFTDTASGNVVDIGPNDVTPSSTLFDHGATVANYTLQSSSAKGIAGSGTVTKTGTGTLTITNSNSFVGALSLNGGTVSVATVANGGVNSPLGAGTSIGFDGGTLQYTGAAGSTDRGIALGAGGGTVTTTNSLTLAGAISGAGVFTKAGSGTVVLIGANTHADTTISTGTLQVGSGGVGGTLGTGTVTNNAALVFDGAGVITATITGPGTVTKTGASSVNLAGVGINTFTGLTTVSAGQLVLNKPTGTNAIGGDVVVEAAGTLRYSGNNNGNQIADTSSITINGGTFGELTAPATNPVNPGPAETVTNVTLNGGYFTSGRAAFNATGLFKVTAGRALAHRGGVISAGSVEVTGGSIDLDGGSTTAAQHSRLDVGAGGLTLTSGTINLNAAASVVGATSVGSIVRLGGDVTSTGTSNLVDLKTAGMTTAVSQLDLQAASRTFNVTGTLNVGTVAKPIIIIGAGGIIKTGSGTLNLAGANTYAGGTDVNGGTLFLNGTLASGVTTVSTGGTLAGTGTIAGSVNIANTGALSVGDTGGAGAFTFNSLTFGSVAGNTMTVNVTGVSALPKVTVSTLDQFAVEGVTTFNIAGASPGLGSFPLIDYNGLLGGTGTFAVGTLPNRVVANVSNDVGTTQIMLNITGVDFPVWKGNLSNEWSTMPIQNWVLNSNNATPTNFLVGDNVLFNDIATSGTPTVDISAADVAPASVSFANIAKDYTITGTSGIAGSTGITKTGAGKVTISNTNSFTGAVNMNGGTVSVAAVTNSAVNGPLGAGTTLAFDGGTLEFTGVTGTTNRGITLNAGGGTVKTDTSLTLAGLITGAGPLAKTGTGALLLTGANANFNGGLGVQAGKVSVATAAALGGNTQTVTVSNNATLEFTNTGAATIFSDATALRTLAIGAGGATIAVTDNSALTASGVTVSRIDSITGSALITKTGSGVLRLNAAQTTLTSNWVLNAGALEVSTADTALGSGSVTVNPTGTLVLQTARTIANSVTLAGGAIAPRSGDVAVFAGPVNVTAPSTVFLRSNSTQTATNSLTIGGVLSGGSDLTLTGVALLTPGKFLTLTNPLNTYSGTFHVTAGQALRTLPATTGNTLGTSTVSLSDSSLLLSDDGTGNGGNVAYGNNLTVATGLGTVNVDRVGAVNTGNVIHLGTLNIGANTLNVTGANGYGLAVASTVLSGAATFNPTTAPMTSGPVSGSFGITKSGAGSLTLTGASSFTGAADVTAGALIVNGSLSATTSVTVSGTGSLGGSGTIPGTVSITGTGTLAPGQSAGTLSSGPLTIDPTATLGIEIGGTAFASFDRVSVTGGISLDGTLSGSLINGFGALIQPNDLFAIILNDDTDAVTGNLSDTAQGGLITFAGGQQFFISYTGNFDGAITTFTGGNDVVLQAIPEPSAFMSLIGGLGMFAGLRRMRRRA